MTQTLDVRAVQRRTVRTLVAAQAIGALGITVGIATASLLAEELSGSESLAGLAQTTQVLGAAVGSYLLAGLVSRRGRRVGMVTGMLVASLGGAICVTAGALGWMWLLLIGTSLLGAMSAANASSRYAATDLAEEQHRGRDLSLVVWATTVGAVLGPNLAGPSGSLARAVGLPPLTGPFLVAAVAMLAASVVVGVRLRPDPLLLARSLAGEPAGGVRQGTAWRRALETARERPGIAAAVAGMAGAHAAMVGVMVMTPLHMQHGGAHLHVIGFVISVHVLGMFAFSPLVGWAADTLGRPAVLLTGGLVLLVALLLAGISPGGSSWQIFAGLFLLGMGWSFATVAASTLLVELTPLEVRTDVQGVADLVMGLTAAAAGGLAGLVVGVAGFGWLNLLAGALALLVVGAGLAADRATRAKSLVAG